MNDDLGLGKVITTDRQRDAIHIAVVPVTAGCAMRPGEHVRLSGPLTAVPDADSPIGVIDPFLTRTINEGERVWLFLNPGTITGLRHEWTHPAFPIAAGATRGDKEEAEKWLRNFCQMWRFGAHYDRSVGQYTAGDYEQLIAEAQDPDGYIAAMGRDLHSREELGDDEPLFWHYLSIVTGKAYSPSHRESFGWSCSC